MCATVIACAAVPAAAAAPSSTASTPGTTSAATPSGTPGTTSTTAGDAPGALPITYVDARGVTVTVTSTARLIPIDGDVAEVVFALGLGDRVVATDLSATYPPQADALPQIGYQRALSAEPILAFDPTLVIGTALAGPPGVIDELERVVPVAIVPTPADETGPGTKIRAIAELLGVADVGERLATTVEAEIAVATRAAATAKLAGLRVAMLYLRGEGTQLLFGKGTGIDWLIHATGATDVADQLGILNFANVTAEALTAAAPDVLLVTTDGLASVGGMEGLLDLPAVAGTPAAANRAVLVYDAQLMLGNGPRTGAFLATLVADLTTLRARLDADKETS